MPAVNNIVSEVEKEGSLAPVSDQSGSSLPSSSSAADEVQHAGISLPLPATTEDGSYGIPEYEGKYHTSEKETRIDEIVMNGYFIIDNTASEWEETHNDPSSAYAEYSKEAVLLMVGNNYLKIIEDHFNNPNSVISGILTSADLPEIDKRLKEHIAEVLE